MARRAIGVFFAFCLLMGVISLRIVSITMGEYAAGASSNNTKSIEVSDERAPIYDCNGKRITNSRSVYFAAIKPTAKALSALYDVLETEEFEVLKEKVSKGYPAVIRVDNPDIYCEDIEVIETVSRYSEKQLASHLIGYTDSQGKGVSGLEKSFDSLFSGNRRSLKAVFASDAQGRTLSGAQITQRVDNDYKSAGVYLTIDLEIQKIVEECMDSFGVDIGSVVVLDHETGAIRAMASRPFYNPLNVADSLDDKDSPFVNRALCSFAVGSVFKPAIAAAALEQGIGTDIVYNCTGSIEVNGIEFGCYENTAHGTVDMCGAIEKSCNSYFINLTQQMNKEMMISTLSALGFGGGEELCVGIESDSGKLPQAEELDSPAAVANLSFGQGDLLATPLQMVAYMNAIASGGIYKEPFLIEKTVDKGQCTYVHESRAGERVLSERTCTLLAKFLQSAVENGNARGAKPQNCTAAGKTATAQTGMFENGVELYNTWFAGWFPAESPKYIVVVMKEKGAGGASDCAPVFRQISDAIENAGLFLLP